MTDRRTVLGNLIAGLAGLLGAGKVTATPANSLAAPGIQRVFKQGEGQWREIPWDAIRSGDDVIGIGIDGKGRLWDCERWTALSTPEGKLGGHTIDHSRSLTKSPHTTTFTLTRHCMEDTELFPQGSKVSWDSPFNACLRKYNALPFLGHSQGTVRFSGYKPNPLTRPIPLEWISPTSLKTHDLVWDIEMVFTVSEEQRAERADFTVLLA